MKMKLVVLMFGLLVRAALAQSTAIPIPNGDFENINGSVNAPILLGTATGKIGAWSASFDSVLNLGGSVACSNAITYGWLTPPSGSYELQINIPAGVADQAGISQTLTNKLIPDSVYTLTVDVGQGSTVGLLNDSSISLMAGTNGASFNGTNLENLLNSPSTYQTATLTYKTGNTVPTNNMAISFSVNDVADVGGTVYVDDFQLSVAPIQVAINSSFTPGNGGNGSLNITGTGGASGAVYKIYSSTNLLTPFANWTAIITNHFDANGVFSQPIVVDPTQPCRFYRTVIP